MLSLVLGCESVIKDPDDGQVDQPLQLAVAPGNVDFIVPAGGPNPAPKQVSITNAGPAPVNGLGLGTILYEPVVGGWLTASIGGASSAPATLVLSVDVAGMLPGLYLAVVPVVSSVTGVLPRDVIVALQVSPAPIIRISPDTVSINGTVGGADPAAQQAAITNIGTGPITGMNVGTISYDASGTGWLSGSLNQPTDPATLSLQATTAGLAAGVYSAIVPVESNVAGIVPDSVRVVLTMTTTAAPPLLAVAPTDIRLVADAGGGNPPLTVVSINNGGGGTLSGLTLAPTQYQPSGNWLTATLNNTTAPTTVDISASIISLVPGHYRARVPVTAAGVAGSPRNVVVDLTVNAAPSLAISPAAVNFAATTGQPAPSPQQVTITNGGAGTLTGISAGPISYGAGQPTGWLQASLNSTTTPTALILTTDPAIVLAGSYTATIPVSTSTPGVTSKTITVSLDVASRTGFFNIIDGDGQTGLVDSTLFERLVARVTDANFNPVAGAAVVWTVNNGGQLTNVTSVTNAIGEVSATWTLGHLAGIHTVRVSSPGLPSLTFSADAQLPRSGGSSHPNEPAGFVRFAEHNMSSLPAYPRSIGGLAGSWFGFPQNDPDLVLVTPDTAAPESPPNVIQTKFKQGLNAGSAPVNMGGWDAAGSGAAGQKSKMYLSVWVKIVGPDYENQLVGTKLGFVGYAEASNSAANQGYWLLAGNGATSIQNSFQMSFFQQNNVTRRMNQNASTARLMTAGVWHQWEVVLELNTLGQANGVFKMWVDGTLIMNYSDVVYITTGETNRFFSWKWNPTWGGIGGVRSRSDQINIDHVYMSGVP
jgi:hypothetical protein